MAGRPSSRCWTYSGFETVKRGCEIIQANLKDVGIDVDVKLTDFGTLSAEMPKAQFDFDLMRWTWPEPNILSLLFKTPGWRQLYADSELDTVLDRADTTMNAARRLDMVKQAQVMILQKADRHPDPDGLAHDRGPGGTSRASISTISAGSSMRTCG